MNVTVEINFWGGFLLPTDVHKLVQKELIANFSFMDTVVRKEVNVM